MRLADKVAIITGGGSGIGAATCKLFAKEGAKVVVADMDETAAKRVALDIEKEGGQAISSQVDVARKEEVDNVVRDVLARWDKVDILVNAAGTGDVTLFIESNEDSWDRILAVNLKGTMLFAHAVLPGMIQRQYGRIINIASNTAKFGGYKQVAYSASKAGVDVFTKALAREVARYNICVNDTCPGATETPMFRHLDELDPRLKQSIVRGVAMRRLAKPEEQAAAALFLASDDSSFVTGHSLVVDGGSSWV